MSTPNFRFVCVPAALNGAPAGWAAEMLRDGEVALLEDGGGFDAVNAVAHAAGLLAVSLIRGEDSPAKQRRTVIAYAANLPTVWVADHFDDHVEEWAAKRGPMTLLVTAAGPLSDLERRRIDRFVSTLGRQSE
jgi:hypothetical protein